MSASSLAHAHHDAPTGLALAFRDAASVAPLVLTNRGLIFPTGSEPAGAFALRCNEAYGVSTTAIPSIVLAPSGALTVQSARGVAITRDQGCTFTPATGLPDVPLGGLAQSPTAPAQLLLSTQDYAATSHVFASDDHGQTWTARARNAPFSVYDLLVFGADGARVYASGARYDHAEKQLIPTWAVSRDGGASFVDRDVTGLARVVLGAHPRDVDTVFARETASTGISQPHDYLLRSLDGGETFTRVHETLGVITSFATSPDGSRVYVGTEVTGLHVSRDGGATFARVASDDVLSVHCLHHRDGALWMCATRSPYTQGVWSTADDGQTLTDRLPFARVATQVTCHAPSNLCDATFRAWQEELASAPKTGTDAHGGGPSIITSGAPSSAPKPPAPTTPEPIAHDEGGGCTLATINQPTRELCWLLALSLLVARRKKPS
ncbi:MAG: hypothetical protein ABW252_08925 [Polyangiales bacterium]